MDYRSFLAGVVLASAAWSANAQTTQPAQDDTATAQVGAADSVPGGGPAMGPSQLELRANTAYNAGNYAIALPLLKRLAADVAGDKVKTAIVAEQIRVSEKQIAQAADAGAMAAAAAGGMPTDPFDALPVTEATRLKHTKVDEGQTLDLQSIKQLGNFEFDAENGGNIPQDVRDLSGSKVRVRGYMIPLDQSANITQFALVPSLFACCYGQPPGLQHTIVVAVPQGKAVSYYPEEIVIEGVLSVEEKRDEGFIVSIFSVQASSVKPSPK